MSWKKISSREVYDNRFIKLFDEKVIAPTGIKVNYGRVSFKRLAASVLIVDKEKILLVGQHRYPNNFYSWESIQGGGNLSDPPEEIAKREVREEGNLDVQELSKICITTTSNSVTDEVAHLYFCDLKNTINAKKKLCDPTEDLQLRWFNIHEAIDLIHEGFIKDSLTQISIFFIENRLQL